MHQKYFFTIAYNGRGYRGWQNQKDGLSVQEVTETALSELVKKPVTIHGCGRTDAGVHSENYVFHVFLPEVDVESFRFKLNNKLPAQIAVKRIDVVPQKANAQLDATLRVYTYYVHFEKDPYLNNFSTYYYIERLDLAAMESACKMIASARDFRNFCIEPDKHRTTICNIERVKIYTHPHKRQLAIRFSGDHYLRSMIRLLVGELLEVGKGRTLLADFEGFLQCTVKKPKHHKAYAQGLHLSAVQYPFLQTEVDEPFKDGLEM